LAFEGKSWRGLNLPVFAIDGRKGGASGRTFGLVLDAASPELRALLNLPETPASTPVSLPVEAPVKALPGARHFSVAADKQRIIAPMLKLPKGSPERAAAFRQAAEALHSFDGGKQTFTVRTLCNWVQMAEDRGPAALIPAVRRDKGKIRERLSRDWGKGCGLPADVQDRIADQLERTARGLILKGRSDREVRRLCSAELERLTREAGADKPLSQLKELCQLNIHWVRRCADMKSVRDYQGDHKRYSDSHEFHVQRHLTRTPMDVLYGDVHNVDMSIAQARQSPVRGIRQAGKRAKKQGLVTIRIAIIGWMDGSSHYLWATVVILGPGQGVTQQDIARSLFDVMSCPHGGIPRVIVIDNGSEYKALPEAVLRFCAMSELAGMGVVKCRPYSPEGKGRLEGAFGILEARFISALPGYIAGDRMKSPTKSKGKPVDPYPHGPERLVEDITLAVAQFNGTAQDGQLGGLSPKAMLEAKIAASDWRAQVPDAETFDLVFSKEETRDVRKGGVSIGNRVYSGPILAELIGAKQVPFLVPMRNPEGPILHWRDGVIYRLEHETFALNDRDGARRKGEMDKLQKAEMARRTATADQDVDVQALLSASADLGPVAANPPDTWTVSTLDKAGVIGGAMTEAEAEAMDDAKARADMESILEEIRQFDGKNGPAAATAGPNSAT
jgi:hypothetical protein